MIETAVAANVRKMIRKMFGTIKTELNALFDKHYNTISSTAVVAAIVVVAAVASSGDKDMLIESSITPSPQSLTV